jgi:hypothetical protein
MLLDQELLTAEHREVMRAAVSNGGSVMLFRRTDTRGPAVRTPTKKFFDPRDPSVAERYIAALHDLVDWSLLRSKTAEQFELTNQGWEVAAKAKK